MFWILASILLVLIAGFVVLAVSGTLKFPWLQFYVRGKESGFSFQEINLLRKVAVENRLKNPASLFWSVRTLDRCIRSAIIRFRSQGTADLQGNLEFLSKLFDFRARVEFNQPKYRLGLTSTRAITPGQTFKITMPGSGVYLSKLVETNRRYMAITYPRGNPLPPGFSWHKQQLKVYFWRQEDAGYYFETRVVGDYLDRKVPILHVNHVDSLVRTQKRRSVRREVGVAGHIFPLRTINQANERIENTGGLRCKVLDISEDGAALAVGGKAKAGIVVKLQVELNGEKAILNGVARSVDYKQKNNVSILHIQANKPSLLMRTRILSYVYGLFATEKKKATAAGS